MGHSNREFTQRLGDFSLTSIFPRWTSRFHSMNPAVRIKALEANHLPRFQTDSVRYSAGCLRWTSNRAKLPFPECRVGSGALVRHPYEALKKKMCSEYVKFSGHALSV